MNLPRKWCSASSLSSPSQNNWCEKGSRSSSLQPAQAALRVHILLFSSLQCSCSGRKPAQILTKLRGVNGSLAGPWTSERMDVKLRVGPESAVHSLSACILLLFVELCFWLVMLSPLSEEGCLLCLVRRHACWWQAEGWRKLQRNTLQISHNC